MEKSMGRGPVRLAFSPLLLVLICSVCAAQKNQSHRRPGRPDSGAIDARREFIWWFDPEAARIVLRAPWEKLTITPIDVSVKTRFTSEMQATISKAGNPVTQYLDKYSLPGYMWDEIAGAALIDPSIITGQKQLYMDIDLDHGASYDKTIFWDSVANVPPYLRLANVQFDIDAQKFYKLYIDLMTRLPHSK
jgi:purine nucleosidase